MKSRELIRIFFWLMALFSGTIAILFLWEYMGEQEVSAIHYLIFVLVWVAIILIATNVSEDPISPLWFFVVYLFAYFFIRPIFLMTVGGTGMLFEFGGTPLYAKNFLQIDFFLFLAFLMFVFGYRLGANPAASVARYMPAISSRILGSRLVLFASILLLSSVLSYLYIVFSLGGFLEVMARQAALVHDIPDKGMAVKLAWIIFNLYFVASVLFLIAWGPSKTWWMIFVLGVILALTLGRRSPILALFFPYLVYYHYYVKAFTLRKAFVVGGACFFLLVSMAVYRVMTSGAGEGGIESIFVSAEFFVWDMNVAILNTYGESIPFRNGLDFLPYWLREGFYLDSNAGFHSVGAGLVNVFLPDFRAGIPAGFMGTLYMNGGWGCLILGMTGLGFFARCIYEYTQLNATSRISTLLIFPSAILFFFYFLRLGDPWLAVSSNGRILLIAFFVGLFLTGYRLVRGRKKETYEAVL